MSIPKPPYQPEPLPPDKGGSNIEYVTTCKTCGLPVQCAYCASLSPIDQVILEHLRLFATYYSALLSFSRSQKGQDNSSGGSVPPEKEM